MLQSLSLRGLTLALAVAMSTACDTTSTAPVVATPATITVDATTAPAYLAFADDAATAVAVADPTASTAWDLSLLTTTVAANGAAGVSVFCICGNESASADAVMAMTANGQLAAFNAVTDADVPATTSFADDVFANHKWYRYNLTGTDNQIWPVFNVYLVRRGTAVYKVQLINYYDTAGAPRHITLRYVRLR